MIADSKANVTLYTYTLEVQYSAQTRTCKCVYSKLAPQRLYLCLVLEFVLVRKSRVSCDSDAMVSCVIFLSDPQKPCAHK